LELSRNGVSKGSIGADRGSGSARRAHYLIASGKIGASASDLPESFDEPSLDPLQKALFTFAS